MEVEPGPRLAGESDLERFHGVVDRVDRNAEPVLDEALSVIRHRVA